MFNLFVSYDRKVQTQRRMRRGYYFAVINPIRRCSYLRLPPQMTHSSKKAIRLFNFNLTTGFNCRSD